jgi:dihydroflavonol-4-reductase
MVAVTGANGLLGSFIVRKLIEHNESFVALKRLNSDITLLEDVKEKITWIDADILDPVALSDAFKDVSHVIHTAAIVTFNPQRAKEVMDINVQGTRNVVNTCLTLGIKRLVHISSVAALGRQKDQKVVNEDDKWIESSWNSVYAKSKYLAELEVFRGQEEGISSVILNPSLILAEANWNISSAQLFKYVWNEKPFYFDGFVNYVDVKDVSELTHRLLSSNIEGIRLIVSAGKISYKDFFGKLAKEFSKKPPSIRLTAKFLKFGAMLETFYSQIVGAEPRLTKETARLAGSEFLFENKKIRNLLNFEFQEIDKTLQRCCRYYIMKGKPKK